MRIRLLPVVFVPALVAGLVTSLPAGAAAQSADATPIQRWPSAVNRAATPAPSAGQIAFARSEAIAVPAAPSNRSDPFPADFFGQPANDGAQVAPLAGQQRFEQRRSPGGGGGVRGGGGTVRGGTAGPRVAVPRDSGGVRGGGVVRGGVRPGRVVVAPRVYGGYPFYPYYYPFAFSGFYGGGFYDSYWGGNVGWGGPWGPGWGPGWGGAYYGGGYPVGGRSFDFGRLRLQVQPRDAEVFVDGYYAGLVDDFDGRFQGLQLETGGYKVEIRKPGWESLTFDVRVTPDRTTSYKGELIPQNLQTP